MSGHGPESSVFEKASTVELKPMKVGENSLSFMFETAYMLKMPKFAMTNDKLDNSYQDVRTN
jgi:homogentisate 1,2-dioxygenase